MIHNNLTKAFLGLSTLFLASCSDVSYVQTDSPANAYKDYRENGASVIGVGTPISDRKAQANATMKIRGNYALEDVMDKVSNIYNLAIRWGEGVHKSKGEDITVSDLTFDELRNYIEDVYAVQIVREGERRLLVLPSLDSPRIKEFAPGNNVSLSQVVRGLANQCGFNLVISENKKVLADTLITTDLRDIDCIEAFDAVLNPHSLTLVDRGEYYAVEGFPQRQWVLNLYEPEAIQEVNVEYSSSIKNGSEDGGGDPSGGSSSRIVKSERNLWGELETNLTALINKSCVFTDDLGIKGVGGDTTGISVGVSQEDSAFQTGGLEDGSTESALDAGNDDDSGSFSCGYVRVNRSIGMVQMRAPRRVMNEANNIIRNYEDIASRRLLVEARLIAVSRSRGFEQGTNLSAGAEGDDKVVGLGYQSGSLNTVGSSVAGRLISLINENGGGFLGVSNKSLDLVTKLSESFGTTYQLMKPTIEVMDRQQATLIDGRNERYFIREGETETTDTGTIRNVKAEERVQFVGIQFAVTAQIADAGELHTLHLQIPITEISRFVNLTQVFDSETFTDEIPIATTRVIDQKVRIKDGEVKVIGGLTRRIAVDRESGVPLIRGIPIAGKLFNEEDIRYEDAEFLVLLQVKRLY